jgi:hypothetical protein
MLTAMKKHKGGFAMHISRVNYSKYDESKDDFSWVNLTRKEAIAFVQRWRGRPIASFVEHGILWLFDARRNQEAAA